MRKLASLCKNIFRQNSTNHFVMVQSHLGKTNANAISIGLCTHFQVKLAFAWPEGLLPTMSFSSEIGWCECSLRVRLCRAITESQTQKNLAILRRRWRILNLSM